LGSQEQRPEYGTCAIFRRSLLEPHPGPERRPTRPGLPDYGEFGRFERLVYAAYIWLVLAAGCDIVTGLAALLQRPVFLQRTAI
jgi:hypothetical protein